MSALPEVTDWSSGYRELWQAFSRSDSQAQYCQAWLSLQCARIGNARRGVLVLRTGDLSGEEFVPVSRWPEEVEPNRALVELAERVIEEETGLVTELGSGDAGGYGVAYPLKIDRRTSGIVAIGVAAGSDRELGDAMEKLQWGVAWIEVMLRRQQQSVLASDLPRLRATVEVISAVLAEPGYAAACNTFVTELATALGCERVSLGMRHLGRLRVAAVSHSAEFGKRMNLTRLLSAAMDESVCQRTDILFPEAAAGSLVTRDHASLAAQHGCGAIYTFPLFGGDGYYGALSLEREAGRPFSDAELETVRAVGALAGAALREKKLNDRPVAWKLADALGEQWFRIVGSGHPGTKLVLAVLVVVVGYFSVATDTYRVAADTYLEGDARQAVVAPFDGYIETAAVRAGDTVTRGEIMSRLDDRDLRLERLDRVSEASKLERQHEEAVARHDRAHAGVLAAELAQNRARLDLVENRLARTELRAPFDGLVLSGDLSQRLGSAVKQGDVLFEVAPLGAYRLILWVDEHEIAEIRSGQHGTLVLKALPDRHFAFTVQRVTPISKARHGGNFFRVEAGIEADSPRLRPGMEGIGKVEIGERKQIDTLTRSVRRWLKLRFWAWSV